MKTENIKNIEYATLFKDLLSKDIDLRVKVTGGSMTPFLKSGEIVTVRKVHFKEINIGDLILFKDDNGFSVLHRIVSIKKNNQERITFITKGDRIISIDNPVREDMILGKAIRIEKHSKRKGLKSINLESPVWKKLNFLIAIFSLLKAKLFKISLSNKYSIFNNIYRF